MKKLLDFSMFMYWPVYLYWGRIIKIDLYYTSFCGGKNNICAVFFQFVPYKDFQGRSGENQATVQARLAQEVLEEIPDQFLSYMKSRNIKPKPPMQRQLTISSLSSLPPSEHWREQEKDGSDISKAVITVLVTVETELKVFFRYWPML